MALSSVGGAIKGAMRAASIVEDGAEAVIKTAGKAAGTLTDNVISPMAQSYINAGLKDNVGWSRKFIPKVANAKLGLPIMGAAAVGTIGYEGVKSRNSNKLGYVSYQDGPARMTSSQTTGALQVARSQGSREGFEGIAKAAMKTESLAGKINDFGATGDLVFALHNAR